MSTDAVAVLGFVALFVLMLLRVPVGMAMGLVGVTGFSYLVNGDAALKIINPAEPVAGVKLLFRVANSVLPAASGYATTV